MCDLLLHLIHMYDMYLYYFDMQRKILAKTVSSLGNNGGHTDRRISYLK